KLQLQRLDPVLNPEPELSFEDFPELHYCAFVLVEKDGAPYLAFEGNIDGEVEAFLHGLAKRKEWLPGFEGNYPAIDACREGQLVEFLLAHDVGPGTWYVAFRGGSAGEIRNESELQQKIQAFLEAQATLLTGLTGAEVRAAIQDEVRRLRLDEWVRDAPEKPFLLRYDRRAALPTGAGTAVGFLPVTLLLLGAGALALARVRQLERRDEVDPIRWDSEPIRDSEDRDDRTFQNHMGSVP